MARDYSVYTMMQDGTPYKSYIKTIFGKVFVNVLSVEDETKMEGRILYGNPKSKEETCIVDLWNEKQVAVFLRFNEKHIKAGRLVEYVRTPKQEVKRTERTMAEYSDAELLDQVLGLRYPSLAKAVQEMDNEVLVYRLLSLAEDNDKTAKTVELLKSKLAELQNTVLEDTTV